MSAAIHNNGRINMTQVLNKLKQGVYALGMAALAARPALISTTKVRLPTSP
jgi:hypothetical protein